MSNKKHITITLSPVEALHFEEVCEYYGMSKSQFVKICFDYQYRKEVQKKKFPLEGLMEKYHITADVLGRITNTRYRDIDHAAMSELCGGK